MEKLLLLTRLSLLVLTSSMLAATAVRADDDDHDHDLARQLVEKGEIRALPSIVEELSASVPGKVLEVEFENEKGVYKYELKVLRSDGKLQEVEVDARNGQILKVEDDD